MRSDRIRDPYFRRLRKALLKAERFSIREMRKRPRSQDPRAFRRWNRIIDKCIRVGAL